MVLSCHSYAFYSNSRPGRTPERILTVYGLNDAPSSKDVPFVGFNDNPQFQGVQSPKKNKKEAWLGTFQPNCMAKS